MHTLHSLCLPCSKPPPSTPPTPCNRSAADAHTDRSLYEPLANGIPGEQDRATAADFLRDALRHTATGPDDLPDNAADRILFFRNHGACSLSVASDEIYFIDYLLAREVAAQVFETDVPYLSLGRRVVTEAAP